MEMKKSNLLDARFMSYRLYRHTHVRQSDFGDDNAYYAVGEQLVECLLDDETQGTLYDTKSPTTKSLLQVYTETPKDLEPAYRKPRWIEPFWFSSNDSKLRFFERFVPRDGDNVVCMYKSAIVAAVRRLAFLRGHFSYALHGHQLTCYYDPQTYNEAGVKYVLDRLYNRTSDFPMYEPTHFDIERDFSLIKRTMRDKSEWRKTLCGQMLNNRTRAFNAWMDIENGLLWALGDISPYDIDRNIKAQVVYWDTEKQKTAAVTA